MRLILGSHSRVCCGDMFLSFGAKNMFKLGETFIIVRVVNQPIKQTIKNKITYQSHLLHLAEVVTLNIEYFFQIQDKGYVLLYSHMLISFSPTFLFTNSCCHFACFHFQINEINMQALKLIITYVTFKSKTVITDYSSSEFNIQVVI